MQRSAARPLLTVMSLVALFAVVLVVRPMSAQASGSLSSGNLTMVSTRADGTAGPGLPNTFGADQEAISDDGKVIAFVSPVPAEQLVTDPVQTGHVTDTNGVSDVFVWDSRVPSPVGPIVSLVSWNKNHNGTADGASQHPIMAPAGLGVVFESGADDLVTVPVGSFSNHLYAWAPAVSDVFPVFMVDQNYQGSAGANSVASDASIAVSLLPTPRVNVAFTSSATDLVDPNVHPANGPQEVYVRSITLPSPSTELVSVGTDGKGTASGAQDPQIAADGIHVVFSSGGDSLVSGVNGTSGNIFERNLLTDSTTLISKAQASSQGTSGNADPVVSADGTAVAWDGNDPALSAIPFSGNNHIFYWRGSGVQMVDTNVLGVIGCNSASNNPGLSLDGTAVVFESTCTDMTSIPSSGSQVFTRRLSTTQNVPELSPRLVSVNDAGTGSGNSDSFICPGNNPPHCGASTNAGVAINFDGTAITFSSGSSDIGTPAGGVPPFSAGNVFIRYPDFPNGGGSFGKTVNLTVNSSAHNPDGVSRDAVISSDGGSVAFVSLADDFGITDGNNATDVFESDLHNKYVMEPIAPVSENAGSVTITVDRTGNAGTTDKLEVKTGDGSVPSLPLLPPEITNPGNSNAVHPGDYTETDKTLTFAPGELTHTFTIPITDDNVPEDPELFHVSMSNVSGAGASLLPGPLSQSYVVILDDDADTTDPDVTINQAAGQDDPTSTAPIEYTVTFSEPITGFDNSDVDLTGSTAGGTLTPNVSGGPTIWTVDITGMTTSGTVIATIPAGAAHDAAANPSTASTSTDHTVAWVSPADTTDPDVTINQAAGQDDPTSTAPIEYTVTFSEPITGFDNSDVDLTGSTAGGTLTPNVSGGPTIWTVDITGMTTSGTVIATIPAGAAHDAAANPNTASTSTDHTVAWVSPADTTDPDVTINQAAGQDDPTSTAPIEYTVTFSEPITGFDNSDVDLTGSTAGGTLTPNVSGGPTIWTVDITGMTTSGNVIATIPAGAAHDAAANPSTASTSTDHTVAWAQSMLVPSHVALALNPPNSVYGQDVHATATITVDSGTPAGSVQFAVDATNVGSPATVTGGTATSPVLTGPGSAVLVPGAHDVTGTFTPADPLTYAGSTKTTSLVVNKAVTSTTLTVEPNTLVADIAVTAPGAGDPGGTVTFSVDGTTVGSAPVSAGTAQLTYTTPSGQTHNVAAAYSGDTNFAASSDSTARHDPTVTAHIASAHTKTSFGWYRSAVTITFTCTTHGAPLVGGCPSAVTRSQNGAAQSVSRTISATDGGIDTVTVTFNIDHTAPKVTATGVHNGGRYGQPAPKIHCVGSDALSGLASCTITKHTHHGAQANTITYQATAIDKAGNTHTVKGKFTTAAIAIVGVPFSKGKYHVKLAHTYQFVVRSTKRPTYYDAAPAPTVPFKRDFDFRAAGHHRWVLDVTITRSLHHYKNWNLGVKIGSTMHVLHVRVS